MTTIRLADGDLLGPVFGTEEGVANVVASNSLGYPTTTHFMNQPKLSADLHVNATGQIPSMGNRGLIDLDTPKVRTYTRSTGTTIRRRRCSSCSATSLKWMGAVFMRETIRTGSSVFFSPSWVRYDPAAITTRNGALEINLTKVDDPSTNHNLSYTVERPMGPKVRFSGAKIIERKQNQKIRQPPIESSNWLKKSRVTPRGLIVTNMMLPGINNVVGLWPAIWTMGNLGRAGYGATLDGMWPYVYDACDVGTTPNQTLNGGPQAALDSGSTDYGGTGELSYLPGQRLSRCPIHADGTCVGRSAPEIDIFEAQIGGPDGAHVGMVSQSAQWAPFNAGYLWDNSSDNLIIADTGLSQQNTYNGGLFQQATSVVSITNQGCYQLIDQCYAVQGFEYVPGYSDAYITWITDNKVTWTLNAPAVGADSLTGISARPITDKPLYILANLGISNAFGYIDFEHLVFPVTMRIDWVRVYQHPYRINIGCDTPDKPTAAYIATYSEAYTNPLLTTWVDDYKQTNPRNNLTDGHPADLTALTALGTVTHSVTFRAWSREADLPSEGIELGRRRTRAFPDNIRAGGTKLYDAPSCGSMNGEKFIPVSWAQRTTREKNRIGLNKDLEGRCIRYTGSRNVDSGRKVKGFIS
ncbi:beta-glucan synthesis-associated protein-domain-containing protein [Mycena polygramma]|nr:beta-glucan synthesis-associated protein-domain-containing protein [Mycena polygramma]